MGGDEQDIEDDVDSGWGGLEDPSPPTRSMNTAALLEQLRVSMQSGGEPRLGRASAAEEPAPPTPRKQVQMPELDVEPEPSTRRADDTELKQLQEQALASSRRPTPLATPVPPSPQAAARTSNRKWASLPPLPGSAKDVDPEAFARPTPQAMPATRISSNPPGAASPVAPRPTPPPPGQNAASSLRISGEALGGKARAQAQRSPTKLNLSVQTIAAELEKAASSVEPSEAGPRGAEPPSAPVTARPAKPDVELSLDDLDLGDFEAPAPRSVRPPVLAASRAAGIGDLDDLDLDVLDAGGEGRDSAPDSLALSTPAPRPLAQAMPAPASPGLQRAPQPAAPRAGAPRPLGGLGLSRPPGGAPAPGDASTQGGAALRASSGLARPSRLPPEAAAKAEPAPKPGGGISLPPLRPIALVHGAGSSAKLEAARPADAASRAALERTAPTRPVMQAVRPTRASDGGALAPRDAVGGADTSPHDRATPLPDVPGPRDSLLEGSPLLQGLHIDVGEAHMSDAEAAEIAALDSIDLSVDIELPDDFSTTGDRVAEPPPERRSQVEILSPEDEALLQPIVMRFEKGDYMGALMRAEGLLEERPDFEAARRYVESATELLQQMYLTRLGSGTTVLRLGLAPDAIQELSLDHRAGFLISLLDGHATIDEIVDISGMPALEVLRLLFEMYEQGVLAVDSIASGS